MKIRLIWCFFDGMTVSNAVEWVSKSYNDGKPIKEKTINEAISEYEHQTNRRVSK